MSHVDVVSFAVHILMHCGVFVSVKLIYLISSNMLKDINK